MIIWRGWGILVILIAAAIAVPSGFLAAELMSDSEAAGLGVGPGLLLASVGIYFAGRKLNTPKHGFHPATGQPVEYRNTHTFFFVPMQYWAFVLPIAGVAALASSLPL